MALTSCPDCGGKVSDKAVVCPHCGCPAEEIKKAAAAAAAEAAEEDLLTEEEIAQSRTVSTVKVKRKVPTPLCTTDGEKLPLTYDGLLVGKCPRCRRETEFKPHILTRSEVRPKNDVEKKGGLFGSVFKDISKAFKGGKVAQDFMCKDCGTVFQICPECQRPNNFSSDRERCDYCEQILIS